MFCFMYNLHSFYTQKHSLKNHFKRKRELSTNQDKTGKYKNKPYIFAKIYTTS